MFMLPNIQSTFAVWLVFFVYVHKCVSNYYYTIALYNVSRTSPFRFSCSCIYTFAYVHTYVVWCFCILMNVASLFDHFWIKFLCCAQHQSFALCCSCTRDTVRHERASILESCCHTGACQPYEQLCSRHAQLSRTRQVSQPASQPVPYTLHIHKHTCIV